MKKYHGLMCISVAFLKNRVFPFRRLIGGLVIVFMLSPGLHAQETGDATGEEPEYRDPFAPSEGAEPMTESKPLPNEMPSAESDAEPHSASTDSEPNPDINPEPSPEPHALPHIEGGDEAFPLRSPSMPEKPLIFPGEERDATPVTSAIYERERRQVTKTAWSLGFDLGMAMNLNRRPQQINVGLAATYALNSFWELAVSMYYRTVKDQLLGFVAEGRYVWLLYDSTDWTVKILPLAGLGWTLRMMPSGSKFSEGRLTARAGVQSLAYFLPTVAVSGALFVDSYLWALRSGRGAQNLISHGGPPSQVTLALGARWDF